MLPVGLLVPLTVLTLQAQTGARVRADTVSREFAADLLAIPTVSLDVSERDWNMSLGSTTMASYLDIFRPLQDPLGVMENVVASFSYRTRRVTITLSETGQIGYQNLRLGALSTSSLTTLSVPTVGLPPTGGSTTTNGVLINEMALYGSTSTNLLVSEAISRNVTLSQYGRVTASSGFGTDVSLYPSQVSAGVGVQGQYRINERETVGLQNWVDRTGTRGRASLISIGLAGTWTHAFSPRTSGFLNLGASYIFPESEVGAQDAVRDPVLTPNITLGLNMTETPFTVTLGLIPVIDQISGRLDTRVTGSLQYTEKRGPYTWNGALGTSTSMEQDRFGAFVSFFGNAGVGYALTREFQLTAGGGTSYQLAPYADDDGTAIFFAQFGISFTPQSLRL